MPTGIAAASGRSQDVAPLQLAAKDHLAGSVNAMHLKDRFRDVETNRSDRLHIGSSKSWEPQQLPFPWHSRAGGGAVHSIRSGPYWPSRASA